jgi:hypothetical protein
MQKYKLLCLTLNMMNHNLQHQNLLGQVETDGYLYNTKLV